MTDRRGRRGLSLVEVVVVLAIVGLLALFVIMALPRQREAQRFAGCQMNLRQFGRALALYDETNGHLPMVPDLATAAGQAGNSPHHALLEELGLADFRELTESKAPPPRASHLTVTEHSVAGFMCPSDTHATAGLFPAPISYRATTGSSVRGLDGVFAPGRRVSIAEVEAADGSGHTAAFAERLVGNGRPGAAPNNYAVVHGPLDESGCRPAAADAWRGDAGSSWWSSHWPSTLYNHASGPDQWPSCVAADMRSAAMGASSGHGGRVNVLALDGAVRPYTPHVDAKVWKRLAASNNSSGVDQDSIRHPTPPRAP
jgi:prepilin-type N-terminal cleavage/methylation domain-containing protein/prepilin-type processing-associated H-X9-DG protein